MESDIDGDEQVCSSVKLQVKVVEGIEGRKRLNIWDVWKGYPSM